MAESAEALDMDGLGEPGLNQGPELEVIENTGPREILPGITIKDVSDDIRSIETEYTGHLPFGETRVKLFSAFLAMRALEIAGQVSVFDEAGFKENRDMALAEATKYANMDVSQKSNLIDIIKKYHERHPQGTIAMTYLDSIDTLGDIGLLLRPAEDEQLMSVSERANLEQQRHSARTDHEKIMLVSKGIVSKLDPAA